MLDVCLCVIVEEEKERKAMGNLCAEVRGIMVGGIGAVWVTGCAVLMYCNTGWARQCCMTWALTMYTVYIFCEDRCPHSVASPFPLSNSPRWAQCAHPCRLLDHALLSLSMPAQIFSARGYVPVDHYF